MMEIKSQTKRQIQKDKTKRLILETAMQQFGKLGITATRTADIANAAKISHGTVFVHFATQEELLNAVIEEFGERISLRLHELAVCNTSLGKVLLAHLRGLSEYEEFYSRLVIEGRLLPSSSRNVLIKIQSSISYHITKAAEQEMKNGGIKSYPIHLLFNTWIGLIHYYIINNDIFAPGESVLNRYGEELQEHYMNLLNLSNSK